MAEAPEQKTQQTSRHEAPSVQNDVPHGMTSMFKQSSRETKPKQKPPYHPPKTPNAFPCEVGECDRSFSTLAGLLRHTRAQHIPDEVLEQCSPLFRCQQIDFTGA